MRVLVVTRDSAHTPGVVADKGTGTRVVFSRDAVKRPDWAAMLSAAGRAFAKGAEVVMTDERR